jgi:Immunity protein 21
MYWVNSAGGPLRFLSEMYIPHWQGVTGGRGQETDYDRACFVTDYIGMITVDDGYGLVLNDEPLQTTWLSSSAGHDGMLVRWRYAADETSILNHAVEAPDHAFQHNPIDFIARSERHFLFDAGLSGLNFRMGDSLEISLCPGKYKVDTGLYSPDSETGMILLRFRRVHEGQ